MISENELRLMMRQIQASSPIRTATGEPQSMGLGTAEHPDPKGKDGQLDPTIEMSFNLRDTTNVNLFLAVCRKHGLKPYRKLGQRITTVMVRGHRGYLDGLLWPEFQALSTLLSRYLDDIANQIIGEEVLGGIDPADLRPGSR